MNHAVTFGVNKKADGSQEFTVLADPNTPHREQRRNFRVLRREQHGTFDEVQLWTSSGGRVKKQRTTAAELPPVAPVEAPVPESQEQVQEPAAAAQEPISDVTAPAPAGEDTAEAKKAAKVARLAKARDAAAAKKAKAKGKSA